MHRLQPPLKHPQQARPRTEMKDRTRNEKVAHSPWRTSSQVGVQNASHVTLAPLMELAQVQSANTGLDDPLERGRG